MALIIYGHRDAYFTKLVISLHLHLRSIHNHPRKYCFFFSSTRLLLNLKGRRLIFLACFFYYPLPSQVATHCQYLDQDVIKNMKCYYRADFIRNVIHYLGLIPALQSWCNIKVPFLMLPGPGVMFKVEESNEFGENAFIPFIHLSTSVRLCLSF